MIIVPYYDHHRDSDCSRISIGDIYIYDIYVDAGIHKARGIRASEASSERPAALSLGGVHCLLANRSRRGILKETGSLVVSGRGSSGRLQGLCESILAETGSEDSSRKARKS